MAKRGRPSSASSDGEINLGTEAWNVADGYTKIKILRLMIQLDRYELIAQYGAYDMDEEIIFSASEMAQRRVEGINRFLTTLKQLLGNVKFAIKKGDRDKVEEYIQRLENVEKVIEGVATESENCITHELELNINEPHFKKCFNILHEVKNGINEPINKAGLIFRSSEDIDLDKIMSDIVEGG